MDLKARLYGVNVPIYKVSNVKDLDSFGPHVYGAGLRGRGSDQEVKGRENNGLIYTCRGGFIDVAHVRDYADWTVFLAIWLYRNLGKEAGMTLPPEIGSREIRVRAVDLSHLGAQDKMIVMVSVAQYLAYQLSVWHEIAQWHGYGALSAFPQRGSAYAPEDLYSNLLGTKVAAAIIYSGGAQTDRQFARSFDTWLRSTLLALEPVAREQGRAYMSLLDGQWWDSSVRLPNKLATLHRSYELGPVLEPPVVPDELIGATKHRKQLACRDGGEPLELSVVERILGFTIPDIASLRIILPDELEEPFTFPTIESESLRVVDSWDFQAIALRNQLSDRIELQERAKERAGLSD